MFKYVLLIMSALILVFSLSANSFQEFEPNDSYTQANVLPSIASISVFGSMYGGYNDDYDWFRFSMLPGTQVSFRLDYVTSDLSSFICYESNASTIAGSFDMLNPTLTVTSVTGGDYYLCICRGYAGSETYTVGIFRNYIFDPVSFSATFEMNHIVLSWSTASEVGLTGYEIYRNTTDAVNTATLVNPESIQPNNVFNELHSYAIIDTFIQPHTTLYYWLVAWEDAINFELSGPVSVYIGTVGNEDDIMPPPIPLNIIAYPNLFAGCVNITLQSKSNAPVKAAIYNIKGQLIKALSGSKAFTWDGTDTNNQPVSNGIYFIKAEQDGKAVTSKVIKLK